MGIGMAHKGMIRGELMLRDDSADMENPFKDLQ